MADDNTASPFQPKVNGIDYLEAMLSGHRLALLIQDAWRSHVEAAIEPLIEMRVQIGAISFDKDTEHYADALKDKLSEFFKDHIADMADGFFAHDFVQQSHAEIVTTVANVLPNEVASSYDFDVLRGSLREVMSDFVNEARRLPRWQVKSFKEQVAVFLEDLDQKYRRKRPKTPWMMFVGTMALPMTMKKRYVWATRQFARDQVHLLIDDLRNLVINTETKLVEAVLSPQQR